MTTYTIRPATPADLDALVGLRTYAETWLRQAGISQWTDHSRGVAIIQAGIEAGDALVVSDPHGDTVASLTLGGPDLDFWTDSDQLDAGLYLYKFMLGPTARGTGLAEALLDWACVQTSRRGKTWLRLDCWRTNTDLQNYYLRHGFTLVRIATAPRRSSGALMQRPATLRTYAGHLVLHEQEPNQNAEVTHDYVS
jgi:ribosomal protein S18 acetylase RimI-like enzyme